MHADRCGNTSGQKCYEDGNNVAILGDRNVLKKEAEKNLEYTDLTIEIQCTWNVKTNVI
jgi:hypothetical protein